MPKRKLLTTQKKKTTTHGVQSQSNTALAANATTHDGNYENLLKREPAPKRRTKTNGKSTASSTATATANNQGNGAGSATAAPQKPSNSKVAVPPSQPEFVKGFVEYSAIPSKTLEQKLAYLNELLVIYKAHFNNDYRALLRGISYKEYWRFFVNAENAEEGWMPSEKGRPGYLLALMSAFKEMLSMVGQDIDLNTLIKKLHSIATLNVKNLLYDNKQISNGDNKGEYRTINTTGIIIAHLPPETQNELLTEIRAFRSHAIGKGMVYFPLAKLRGSDGSIHYVATEQFTSNDLHDEGEDGTKTEWKPYRGSFEQPHHIQLMSFLYRTYSGFIAKGEVVKTAFDNLMQIWIENYQKAMKSAWVPIEKLKIIFEFIKKCEMTFPFLDFNSPVFSMLLRNFLLIKNGLPPTICDKYPLYNIGQNHERTLDKYIDSLFATLCLAKGFSYSIKGTDDFLQSVTSEEGRAYMNRVFETARECSAMMSASTGSAATATAAAAMPATAASASASASSSSATASHSATAQALASHGQFNQKRVGKTLTTHNSPDADQESSSFEL